jgi:hypothetical protein
LHKNIIFKKKLKIIFNIYIFFDLKIHKKKLKIQKNQLLILLLLLLMHAITNTVALTTITPSLMHPRK